MKNSVEEAVKLIQAKDKELGEGWSNASEEIAAIMVDYAKQVEKNSVPECFSSCDKSWCPVRDGWHCCDKVQWSKNHGQK